MQTAFIIVGSTGAGKSTYTKKLAIRLQAQAFSIDEWMKNLFWMDTPLEGNLKWALERVRRCEEQIWLTARRLLDQGQPVILDLGFSKKEQRDRFKELLLASGYKSELHFLDIPVEVRRKRVAKRNFEKTETFQFEVDEKTFDWMESYFERPTIQELKDAVIITEETVQ